MLNSKRDPGIDRGLDSDLDSDLDSGLDPRPGPVNEIQHLIQNLTEVIIQKNMQNDLAQPNRLTFAIDDETNKEFILNAIHPIRISMPVSI